MLTRLRRFKVPQDIQRRKKTKQLPQVLFWLGLISIPFAWLVWYVGPQMEMVRPVLASISDPALKGGSARGSCRAAGTLGRCLASNTPGSESDFLEWKMQE